MPLDLTRDDIQSRRFSWSLKFSWLPRRCSISNKSIWFKFAYYGYRDDYYRPYRYYAWHDSREHLIWILKGKT